MGTPEECHPAVKKAVICADDTICIIKGRAYRIASLSRIRFNYYNHTAVKFASLARQNLRTSFRQYFAVIECEVACLSRP